MCICYNCLPLLLTARRRKNATSEEPIFQCIGMLASAVGPNLTKLLHDQLDLMLACGLSEPLIQALAAIAKFIPPLLKTIQGKSARPGYEVTFLPNRLRSSTGAPFKPPERTALQATRCTSSCKERYVCYQGS